MGQPAGQPVDQAFHLLQAERAGHAWYRIRDGEIGTKVGSPSVHRIDRILKTLAGAHRELVVTGMARFGLWVVTRCAVR